MKQTFEHNRMTLKLLSLGIIALFIMIGINSCKHEIPVVPDTGNQGGVSGVPGSVGRSCSADSVYFANDILPIITSGCAMSRCHDAISHKEGVILTSYNNIMKYVIPFNTSNSKLYRVIVRTDNERMPPPPMASWTTDQVNKLQKWINQGTLNNACDKCDTADYKYSTAIKPIIENKCKGCHNPASLGGGIDLSTYSAVKTIALTGKLIGSVTWATGFKAMPQGGIKMPECEIKQVKKWIDAGTLNN
jgi:uncharacterized membrane protein